MSYPDYPVNLYRCRICGAEYPMVPYFPMAAPHGPNQDCRSRDWELISENVQRVQEKDQGS